MTRFMAATLVILSLGIFDRAVGAERCGGTERWAVKLGTDPDASNVDRSQIRDISVSELNDLPQLRQEVPANDDTTRLEQERAVYRVSGRLVLFKDEGDDDYHLVITDDTLKYTPGGRGTAGKETGTSLIVEIPDPKCYAGKQGDPGKKSEFEEELRDARIKFEKRFPNGEGHDTDLGGIPVTISGVAFYDRQHLQTGRARNGIELHPLLDIQFNDEPTLVAAAPAALVATPAGGSSSLDRGTWSFNNPALREANRLDKDEGEDEDKIDANSVRLGGNGRPQIDSIWQAVRIRSSKASVRFLLRVKTNDVSTTRSMDTLAVQVRTPSGKLRKTIARFSNANAARRPRQVDVDVSEFRGQTVRLQITSSESSAKATEFVIGNARVEYR